MFRYIHLYITSGERYLHYKKIQFTQSENENTPEEELHQMVKYTTHIYRRDGAAVGKKELYFVNK